MEEDLPQQRIVEASPRTRIYPEHILVIICWKYVIEVCTHNTALHSLTGEIHTYPSFYNYYCGFHLTTS
jgi:hypothetical protein